MFKLAELFVQIDAITKPFDAALKGMHARLGKLATTPMKVPGGGLLAALGIGSAGLAVKEFFTKTVGGASDLNETVNKVNEVFGKSAVKVTGFADEMARALGLPKREMMDAASSFGLIASATGMGNDAAADMSVHFAKLAADASSFYNIPLPEALEKIRSGLVGEAEPMRALGVLLDEESVKQEAYRSGLAKTGAELTQAQKVQARAALITRGLATATGDLERTQSGMANQTREFWGRLQNLGDAIGEKLLPAFTSLMNLLNEVVGSWSADMDGMGSAFDQFAAGLQAGIDFLGMAWRNWGDIVELATLHVQQDLVNVGEAFDWLMGAAGQFLDWFGQNWFNIWTDVNNISLSVLTNIQRNFAEFAVALVNFLNNPTAGFDFNFTPLLEGFQAATEKMPEIAALNFTNPFEAQMTAAMDRISAREAEHLAKMGGEAKKAGAKAGAGAGAPGAVAAKPAKSELGKSQDLIAFAKSLQEGALGKEDDAKKTALNTSRIAEDARATRVATERALDVLRGGIVGVAGSMV